MSVVKREKWVSARTSATSGTAVVSVKEKVDDLLLKDFDELQLYLDVNTALVGIAPTMDLYLQRAVVPNPVQATDGHWDDLYAFPQVTTTLIEKTAVLPVLPSISTPTGGTRSTDRQNATLAADTAKVAHWGDRIRIVEKMGGTVTTAAIYDLSVVGVRRE